MKLLSTHTPLSAAITKHYPHNSKNQMVAPSDFKFNKSHSWLFYFLTQPSAQVLRGLYLHSNDKHKEYVFHSTHLRRCKVFLTETQNISAYSNIKILKGNRIPLPYLKSQGTVTMTWNLLHLKSKHFTPTPTLKSIYAEQLTCNH